MFKYLKLSLIIILSPLILAKVEKVYKKEGPRGMPFNKTTSCAEFGKNARFNPYSIVGDHWFVFYYWASPRPAMSYKFRIPSKRDTSYLHYLLDGHVKSNFNWSATMVLMVDQSDNNTSLMVQKGDRGQYWIYLLFVDLPMGQLTKRFEIQIKQTGDNKYIGVMDCKAQTAFVMSRVSEVPPKNKLQDEAAKLGYRGRKGKSYLYQGHEWMPIAEADEQTYWEIRSKTQQFSDLNSGRWKDDLEY